jgi:2-C-methyl-D-erythritol 4-phosphate cytidylyltransferase/2-C-methyl-D-erythritol 2,4-cyclodiphosphate synthase
VASVQPRVSAILAAGGRGTRFGSGALKQLQMLGGVPILQRSLDALVRSPRVSDVIVALPRDLLDDPPPYLTAAAKPLHLVEGGARRQDSVARAFARVALEAEVVLIHDAARPLLSEALIERTIEGALRYGAAVAAMPATDTVKRADTGGTIVGTVPRSEIFLAQTPQTFLRTVLHDALQQDASADVTDEAMLAERAGHVVHVVPGDPDNLKITTPDDLRTAERLLGVVAPPGAMRIGIGYDLHRLTAGRPLVLGGVRIPFEKGLLGHSDADAVCHAATDAILGAVGAGDIGRHFPDTDAAWKDADSLALLAQAARVVRAAGFAVVNVDVVVIAERPKLVPYLPAMRAKVAGALAVAASAVSIKGKTNEGVGDTGAGDAIAVHAVALVASLG